MHIGTFTREGTWDAAAERLPDLAELGTRFSASAGGMAARGTSARGRAQGLDAEEYLRAHNAYPYLCATDDLLITGPTQTNVNDLVFVFVGTPE